MPIPAGIIGDDLMSAPVAGIYMTTENGGPAVLDGLQSTEMPRSE
jgi:hypothetical protein